MLPVDEIRLNFNPASLAVLNAVLAFLMFGISLDTRIEDFKRVLRMPLAFTVGIVAQFLFLPAITFGLTLLLGVGPSIALGMILVACCPPGNVSNILTHRANGNVALSVSMTAVSNAIAIVAMPLNFAFWGGLHPTASGLLKTIALDPVQMVGHILLIIGIPFVLGVWLAQRFPAATARFKKPVRFLSFLALIGFIVGAIAGNWRYFLDYVGLVIVAVAIHDALAFLIGGGGLGEGGGSESRQDGGDQQVLGHGVLQQGGGSRWAPVPGPLSEPVALGLYLQREPLPASWSFIIFLDFTRFL